MIYLAWGGAVLIILTVTLVIWNTAFDAGREAGRREARRDAAWLQANTIVEAADPSTLPRPQHVYQDVTEYGEDIDPLMLASFKEYREDHPNAPFGPWHEDYRSLK